MDLGDRGHLEIFDGPGELADALAQVFVDEAQSAITSRGGFYVALAGGTTPKAAYELLAQEARRDNVSWKDVFVYFGDERCVPPHDPQSNYLMAKTAFLDAVNIPAHNVHRMHGEDDPNQAAASYSEILKEDLGDFPRLDLIMLGMGTDGHTASLFPSSAPHETGTELVEARYVEKLKTHRLTLTLRTINNARRVVIATEGVEKAFTLNSVLMGPLEPDRHPVQGVHPTDGVLTWLVDAAAASDLPA